VTHVEKIEQEVRQLSERGSRASARGWTGGTNEEKTAVRLDNNGLQSDRIVPVVVRRSDVRRVDRCLSTRARRLHCFRRGKSGREHARLRLLTRSLQGASIALHVLVGTSALSQTPARPPARWTLTETLRIGGGDTGPTSFNYIKSIAVDAKGRMFIYDRQAKEIRVFGTDGTFQKTIGRVGSGPGELRDAEGIAFARDGMLWMRDAANARLTVFDAEGAYRHGWTMTFCSSQGPWNPQMDNRGRLLDVDCMVKGGEARGDAILGYHLDRTRIDTIADMPACGTRALADAGTFITKSGTRTTYRSIPYAPTYMTALGPAGEVWCVANSASYSITRIVPGSRDTLRVSRRVTSTPLSDEERKTIITQLSVNTPGGLEMARVPKSKPAIARVVADGDGRLWVMRSAANDSYELDVIDPKGQVIATMSLGQVKTSSWTPLTVRGDNMYLVVFDEDDVPFVARLRISR